MDACDQRRMREEDKDEVRKTARGMHDCTNGVMDGREREWKVKVDGQENEGIEMSGLGICTCGE